MGVPYVLQPFGVDLFCLGKKFLVMNLVDRNVKVKYRRSFLGAFWTLLAPLSMAMVYYVVFKKVLNVQIPNYLPFVLSGVIPWAFFSQTVAEGMETLANSQAVITKIPIPLQVLPFVGALTNLVTLTLALPVLLGASYFGGAQLGSSLILMPFYFLSLFLSAYALGLVMAISFVYFRDLRHVLNIVLQLWFYSTPVLYPASMIPSGFSWVVDLNPVGNFFVGIRAILVSGEWPALHTSLVLFAWSFFLVLFAAWFQGRFGRYVVENL
jgi:lipopolysaccharide transport system permease protein